MENQPEVEMYRRPPSRQAVLVLIAGFLAPVGAAFVFGDFAMFLLFVGTLVISLCLGALLMLGICLDAFLARDRLRHIGARISRTAMLPALFLVAQVPGIIAGVRVATMQDERAKRWCERLIPRLEAWRDDTGEYPKDLSQLGITIDPPLACRGSPDYFGTSNRFLLGFCDGGLLSGWEYSSERQRWSHYD
jgi:hypothetical protein